MNVQAAKLDKEYILSKSIPALPKCGIYFLIKGKEIVYVGQSIHIPRRLKEHRKGKDFNRIFFIKCRPGDLDDLEKYYIREFVPRLNKQLNKLPKSKTEYVRMERETADERKARRAAEKVTKREAFWKEVVKSERWAMDKSPSYADLVKRIRPSLYYEAYPELKPE
jgi:predicted GIY-YIG superfamily endonuclease